MEKDEGRISIGDVVVAKGPFVISDTSALYFSDFPVVEILPHDMGRTFTVMMDCMYSRAFPFPPEKIDLLAQIQNLSSTDEEKK